MTVFSRFAVLALIIIHLDARDCFSAMPTQELDATTDLTSVVDRFQVAKDGGPLLLPVVVQKKKYLFVLDTGSCNSCFDKSLCSLLDGPIRTIKMRDSNRDQEATVSVFRSPAATIGKLDMPTGSQVFCFDLRKLSEVNGQEIHGIIGMDFLRKHIIKINLDCGEVSFLRSVGNNPGQRVPIVFQSNNPHVMLEMRGLAWRERFLVDTGLVGVTSGNLEREPFSILSKLGYLLFHDQLYSESITGSLSRRCGSVDSISLQNFCHKKLIFNESEKNVLGLNYWSRYIVTFDFPNNVMYLKKSHQFDKPELCDKSGLDIRRRSGETVVESVDENSPSATVGIKPQDVLLKVNDVNLSEISLWQLRSLLCSKNKKYRLLIRRDKKELEMTINLQD